MSRPHQSYFIMREYFLLLLLAFIALVESSVEFKCNELSSQKGANVRTFEYLNPKTSLRGVVCVAALNGDETLLMYMEEETKANNTTNNITSHKQAIGRAQLTSKTSTLHQYTGIIHVINNVSDSNEDIYDLDNTQFSLSFTQATGIGTLSMKSVHSGDPVVYLWQPRLQGVPRWQMHLAIPKTCAPSIQKSFLSKDPITMIDKQRSPDRKGIVCVLQQDSQLIKFYSIGWKKSGSTGQPRKFIHFGSLRAASPNFSNIFTGKIHSMTFPLLADLPVPDIDRQHHKDSLKITAVKAIDSDNLMIYGDLQEEWIDLAVNNKLNSKYPLIAANSGDFSAELRSFYGLPSM